MPVVKVGNEAFSLLVEEARKLEISTRDLVDVIVLQYFGKLEEEDEDVDEDEEEDDEEDDDDVDEDDEEEE